MELTQLKYFLAAANCGQISRAAELLHISQSAVSMAISRLEKELGVSLFEKQGRSIRLTASGSVFVDMITPAIAELDFAQKQMLVADQLEPDTITLSVEMPDFSTALENIYYKIKPNTRFRQAMDTTESARHKLLCESVDFCLSFEPFRSPDVSSILVLTEPVLVQLHESHPLAHSEGLYLKQLADTPFASFSPEYSFRRWTDGMCFLAGFRPAITFEGCDTQSLLTMVRFHGAAALIARSTERFAEVSRENGNVVGEDVYDVPLLDSFAQRSAYLSYHKNRILSDDAKAFLDYVLQFKTAMERFEMIDIAEKWLLSSG